MKRLIKVALLTSCLMFFGQFGLSSPAAADCLSKNSIVSMENASEGKIAVETSRGIFEFEIAGQCELRSAFDVWGLETLSGSFVCEGDTVLVYDRATLNVLDRCTILMITEKAP